MASERDIELAEISSIMKMHGGRNFMRRILEHAGTYSSTYVHGKTDETIRKSAVRDFGLWLERELKEAAPGEFINLLKEMNDV